MMLPSCVGVCASRPPTPRVRPGQDEVAPRLNSSGNKTEETPVNRKMPATLVILALLGLTVPAAWAASPSGVWRSTSGNTFTIPSSRTDFDIIIKTPKGQKFLGHGAWVKGRVGQQFTYTVDGYPNLTAKCTFAPNSPNTMRVEGPAGVQYWVRVP